MNKRLFISTKESFLPGSEIKSLCYIAEQGLKVLLNHGDCFITCSTEQEAIWFTKAIFATFNIDKPLVIDYNTRSIYEISANVQSFKEEEKEETHTALSQLEVTG